MVRDTARDGDADFFLWEQEERGRRVIPCGEERRRGP